MTAAPRPTPVASLVAMLVVLGALSGALARGITAGDWTPMVYVACFALPAFGVGLVIDAIINRERA